jgi:hypothetical protein
VIVCLGLDVVLLLSKLRSLGYRNGLMIAPYRAILGYVTDEEGRKFEERERNHGVVSQGVESEALIVSRVPCLCVNAAATAFLGCL